MFYEVLCNEPVTAQKRKAVDDILFANKQEGNVIFTSVITHIECVPDKLESKRPGAHAKYSALFDGVHVVDEQITTNILLLAREIKSFYYRPPDFARKFYGKMMDTGDAIHLATAIIFEAAEFHTRDNDAKGSKVPLVDLYKYSGVDRVCGSYDLKIVSPESPQGDLFNAPAIGSA